MTPPSARCSARRMWQLDATRSWRRGRQHAVARCGNRYPRQAPLSPPTSPHALWPGSATSPSRSWWPASCSSRAHGPRTPSSPPPRRTTSASSSWPRRKRSSSRTSVDPFENALAFHQKLFDFKPREKITVLLTDFSDAGNASAEAVPRDFVTLRIAPMSFAFETFTASERMSYLMNHELVHVMTSDRAGAARPVLPPAVSRQGRAGRRTSRVGAVSVT